MTHSAFYARLHFRVLNPHVDPPALLDDALRQQPPQQPPQPQQEGSSRSGSRSGSASPSTLYSSAAAVSPPAGEEAATATGAEQHEQPPPADRPFSCQEEEGTGTGTGGLLAGLARGFLGLSGRVPSGGGGGDGTTGGHGEGTQEEEQQQPPEPPQTQRPRPLALPPPLSIPPSPSPSPSPYPSGAAVPPAPLPPTLLRSLIRASWGKPTDGGEEGEEGLPPMKTANGNAPFRLPASETRRSRAQQHTRQPVPAPEQAPAAPSSVPPPSSLPLPAAAAATARVQDLAAEYARMGVPDERWKLSRINAGYEVRFSGWLCWALGGGWLWVDVVWCRIASIA